MTDSERRDTTRMTMAQALVAHLAAQRVETKKGAEPLFAGVWAIFGHGNVAGLGEALAAARDGLPTFRAHNEQAMAHAAVAFAKATRRKRMMAVTTSIGPGALNLVTAAGVAHVNRLPVLLLPGDVFASRRPDPVLQQVEDFGDPTLTANDCLRPVSRFWDRITRPEQLLTALPAALDRLLDPAMCGPATLCLPQDVQTEALDVPAWFLEERVHRRRRPAPDDLELAEATRVLRKSKRPLLVAGGGVHYAEAFGALNRFAERHGVPVAETQAGKGALPWDHQKSVGALGVTGTSAANALAAEADCVLCVGTRLQDFTTGSWALLGRDGVTHVGLNIQPVDAGKHRSVPLVADAAVGLDSLSASLGDWLAAPDWTGRAQERADAWTATTDAVTAPPTDGAVPTDAQVLGAVNRQIRPGDVVVCAAGGLPGELHKLWRAPAPGGYHVEYGFSCMGYEIAGGLGVALARPAADVFVLVGDGSYLMLNSELNTAARMGCKLTVVVNDNRGFGCINRLQQGTGGERFRNLLDEDDPGVAHPEVTVDFVAHARSLGAHAAGVSDIGMLEAALAAARDVDGVNVIVIETDPDASTAEGGHWWDVAVPEVSGRDEVRTARRAYDEAKSRQR